MTQEEKAKAYDEALERAKKLYEKGTITESIGYIFPELAESEDEKIRNSIIENLKGNMYRSDGDYDLLNKQIAWLEKQGEKPQGKTAIEAVKEEKVDNANKVEPKFHEGDWIVYNYPDTTCPICKIIQVDKEVIDLVSENGCLFQTTLEDLNVNYHLWTIQDAKDGDVLASNVLISKYNKPFIYNGNHNSTHVGAYCGISTENRFNVATEKCRWTANVNIRPASKEQRDLLFQKMREAGYEWDAEKKELKKIESNPAWSEEDEKKIKKIMYIVSLDGRISNEECKNIFDWLESLKDRVQTQKQWKPSEEQIQCLHDAVEHYHTNGYPASKLTELYEQMSKIYKL